MSIRAIVRPCHLLLIAFLVSFQVPDTSAQTMPDDIRRRLMEMGPNYSGPAVNEIFQPLLAAAPKGNVKVTKNVNYGPHPRHVLDVFQPVGKTNAPVFVFVHGGGYVGGSKDANDGNVPAYFARNGLLGITVEYRLAPEFPWPAGGQDVAGAVAWIKNNATQYGGDPNRIYLMGHSAGATHVATYVFDRRVQPRDGHGVTAAILVSGRYRVAAEPDDASFNSVRAYFGADPAAYESRSVVARVPNSRIPVMLVTTQFDQQNLVATTGEMFKALCDRDGGQCPRFVQLKYHNHLSEIAHINTPDDFLGKEILEFIGEMPGAPRRPTSP
jgi:acetyl esterase